MASVQLRNVTKAWGDVVVSKDINLDIHEGEFVVFVGPSGCGKSTLLRMIAGLETITSGDLFIGDTRMNEIPPAERGVGMVFQSYALYPHLSVAENMSFGLKLAFGDNVHCFFAEPTHSPCMLLGVYTGLHDKIAVQDLGIDNVTAADGLAVGRASGFVGRAMEHLLDGFYTLSDQSMYDMLGWLAQEEGIRLEPSALAGMAGPQRVCASVSYQQMHGFSAEQLRNATHLVWATGGGMVPEEEMNQYLAKGR